jgi:chemotaxis-related protein WspB
MLFIIFQLGADRYALDASQIEEILPLVDIKPIPQTPPGVAGVFNYRGAPLPVIDLTQLMLGRPAQKRLSTRIIIIQYDDNGGNKRHLGLIAEKARETVRREASEFVPTGVSGEGSVYLGPVAPDPEGMLQWIDPRKLLPSAVRDALFQNIVES